MKIFFLFIFLTFSKHTFCSEIEYKDLLKVDGIYYKDNSKKSFTGSVTGNITGNFLNGKKTGVFLKFYKDGKILSKLSYRENKLNGQSLEYYRNGNLLSKIFIMKINLMVSFLIILVLVKSKKLLCE